MYDVRISNNIVLLFFFLILGILSIEFISFITYINIGNKV